MKKSNLYNAYRFFKEQAGYCVEHRAEGALQLARAEQFIKSTDWEIVWEDETESHADAFGVLDCCERANRKCQHEGHYQCRNYSICNEHYSEMHNYQYWCAIKDNEGEILASLGMIDDCSNPYRRVVEAELALEAMTNYQDEQKREQILLANEQREAQAVYNYCAL